MYNEQNSTFYLPETTFESHRSTNQIKFIDTHAHVHLVYHRNAHNQRTRNVSIININVYIIIKIIIRWCILLNQCQINIKLDSYDIYSHSIHTINALKYSQVNTIFNFFTLRLIFSTINLFLCIPLIFLDTIYQNLFSDST